MTQLEQETHSAIPLRGRHLLQRASDDHGRDPAVTADLLDDPITRLGLHLGPAPLAVRGLTRPRLQATFLTATTAEPARGRETASARGADPPGRCDLQQLPQRPAVCASRRLDGARSGLVHRELARADAD
ncbi:hypothetical protein ASD19_13445 [Microbacterium sp. Root53]|uniref:hypothetical protein n=1 Tax=Microbacterium sp. Root53 TaxID=1736553 RepID=UPI0006F66111|nr:hypothetical protein [Microbacterium sp. Root53]KQZ04099.1 hypothetical protein ASD19_13445 [Microbacterium sp. Root53]